MSDGSTISWSRTKKGKKHPKIEFKLITNVHLDSLKDSVFNLTSYATEERYRFIDCNAFVNERTLQIYETLELPKSPRQTYTAISYVWLALPASPEDLHRDGSFRVFCGTHNDGSIREDGGPISMKVLGYACRWSLQALAPYLWLDRLCILQTSQRDKVWQISRMYDIYEHCNECVVLPGGLQRLASVHERTTWADRAWTYQETIITWDYAVVLTKDWHRPSTRQQWFIEGECQWDYLQMLFVEGSELLAPRTEFGLDGKATLDTKDPCLILGSNKQSLDAFSTIILWKIENYQLEDKDPDKQIDEFSIQQLVLQCIQMRQSSRPVDMVLSILGLVDAQEGFKSRMDDFRENERFHATLALVEMMLRNEEEYNPGESTLLDVPLWASLKVAKGTPSDVQATLRQANGAQIPALDDLANLLDGNTDHLQCGSVGYKVVPLEDWQYDVKYTEEIPAKRAEAVIKKIPHASLLAVYRGEQDRARVEHEDEGLMEIVQTLDIKKRARMKGQGTISDTFIFAWSLRLEGHPVIRFYKVGLKGVLE